MTASDAGRTAPGSPPVDPELRAAVEAFVFREARLADESRYDEWFALFDDHDVHYWVPSGPADYDPATRVSFINDNRNRLATRVHQLATGVRYAQTPPSPMRRVVSNLELLGPERGGDGVPLVATAANFVLHELSVQASNELRIWAGRVTYRLRPTDDGFLIRSKVVELVNAGRPLPTLAFLL